MICVRICGFYQVLLIISEVILFHYDFSVVLLLVIALWELLVLKHCPNQYVCLYKCYLLCTFTFSWFSVFVLIDVFFSSYFVGSVLFSAQYYGSPCVNYCGFLCILFFLTCFLDITTYWLSVFCVLLFSSLVLSISPLSSNWYWHY